MIRAAFIEGNFNQIRKESPESILARTKPSLDERDVIKLRFSDSIRNVVGKKLTFI